METHPKKIIRAYVTGLLTRHDPAAPEAWPTAAQGMIFNSRDFNVSGDNLPAGIVYTGDETIDLAYRHDGGIRRRILELKIEYYAEGDAGADAVDDGAMQVENAIHADPSLGTLVESCQLSRIDTAFAEMGEIALWTSILTFQVIYYTHFRSIDGEAPVTVLLGYDPETGPGNEAKYTAIIGGDDA